METSLFKHDSDKSSPSGKPEASQGKTRVPKEIARILPKKQVLEQPFDRLLRNELFIPVHRFVYFTDEEIEVIDHPALQRLGNIYQLGQTHYVYRGATHKRLEHVLGVVHVVNQIVGKLEQNYHVRKFREQDDLQLTWKLAKPLNSTEIAFTRLAALLHDIGHLPAGHTLEDEICMLDKHDKIKRLKLIGGKSNWFGFKGHESLQTLINREFRKFLPEDSSGITPFELGISIVLKDQESVYKQEDLGGIVRLQACRDIVGNTICADLLDYLHRDWHHIGKSYAQEDRLLHYVQMRHNDTPGESTPDRFVVWTGSGDEIKTDAFSAILDHLECRYKLSETVLFHKTKCMASAMLERGLMETFQSDLEGFEDENLKEKKQSELVDLLLEHSDESMLMWFQDNKDANEAVKSVFSALRSRKIFKNIFSHRLQQRGPEVDPKIQELFAPLSGDNNERLKTKAQNRLRALRMLEEDFGLADCTLAMYCPAVKMNAKIAQVQIFMGDAVSALSEHAKKDSGIEHRLNSQLQRFSGLWRVQIGIERNQLAQLTKQKDSVYFLKSAITRLIFGIGTKEELKWDSRRIAEFLSTYEKSPFYGKDVLTEEEFNLQSSTIAARGRTKPLISEAYPSKLPRMSNYFEGP